MDFIRSLFICRPVVERDILDLARDDEEFRREDSHLPHSAPDFITSSSDKKHWTSKDLMAFDQNIEVLIAESYALQKARRGYGNVFYRKTTRSQKPPTSDIPNIATVPSADIKIKNVTLRKTDSLSIKSSIDKEIQLNSKSIEQQKYSDKKEATFSDTLVCVNTFSSFTFISKINQIRIRDYLHSEVKNVKLKNGSNLNVDVSDPVWMKSLITTYNIKDSSSNHTASIRREENLPKLLRNYPREVQMKDESCLSYDVGISNCRRELESHTLYRLIENWTSVVFRMT